MKSKKLVTAILALCLAVALCGCNADKEDTPNAIGPSQSVSQGDATTPPNSNDGSNSGGRVDFGLQTAPDPNFDSPASGGSSEKIYTIQGDYAYEMDPNTLEIVGPPLDPITHEPVENPVLDGTNPSTPNNPQDTQNNQTPATSEPPVEPEKPDVPPETSTPPAEEKLPNTGMFLEDD